MGASGWDIWRWRGSLALAFVSNVSLPCLYITTTTTTAATAEVLANASVRCVVQGNNNISNGNVERERAKNQIKFVLSALIKHWVARAGRLIMFVHPASDAALFISFIKPAVISFAIKQKQKAPTKTKTQQRWGQCCKAMQGRVIGAYRFLH